MIELNGKIDTNDLEYVLARGYTPTHARPCPVQTNGKINPHVSLFLLSNGQFLSLFHVKPIYYETLTKEWRPLSEITTHHGNRKIVLNNNWRLAHPRYIDWLAKRQKLLGNELLIPSPFGEVASQYQSIIRPTISLGLTTTTVYPDPDPETTSVDGVVYAASTVWATVRGATTGTADDTTATGDDPRASFASPNYSIRRAFYLFDTSSIPDTDTIDSATMSIYYFTALSTNNADTTDLVMTATTPAANTSLTGDDYDNVDLVTTQGTRQLLADWTAVGYVDIPLNATGIGNISKTGISKFGTVIGRDFDNSAPTGVNGGSNNGMSEGAGTGNDPKLVVVHSVAAVSVGIIPTLLTLGVG